MKLGVAVLVLAILKLLGLITLSWWLVIFGPLLVVFAVGIAALLIYIAIGTSAVVGVATIVGALALVTGMKKKKVKAPKPHLTLA